MTRSGGLPRYRVSIPGRIGAEDRGEMAKVNANMGFYAEIPPIHASEPYPQVIFGRRHVPLSVWYGTMNRSETRGDYWMIKLKSAD